MASGKVRVAGLLAGAVVVVIGCQKAVFNGFLDPSQVGRFPLQSVPQNIQSVVSILDEPLDITAAVEPAAADLEPIFKDYVLGPGDMIRVSIFELLAEGTESTFDRQISETGYISIPRLGFIKIGGMTAPEAETHLVSLLSPTILREPSVSVTILDRRHQTFEMLGAFVATGSYVIPRPDFRLLDAIAVARDIQPGIETIYVLRSYETTGPQATQPAAGVPAVEGSGEAGPMEGRPEETAGAASSSIPSESELHEVLPGAAGGPESSQAAAPARKPIYIEGQWVEVPATREATSSAPSAAPAEGPTAGPAQAAPTTAEVDWAAAITEGGRQRVLRVPVRELLRGDPRFNVVIRPGDKVYAWLGPVGEFYVIGNVFRPGVFSLTGRRVTVRQAIAAAGGLSPLAWPDRCELVRRYNDNQEEIIRLNLDAIFAGTQPDVVLKPNDTINVGTSAVAPFMATVRNAFRLTYGFGFVYDRNYADIDAYANKINPADVRRGQRQQRFGSLFR